MTTDAEVAKRGRNRPHRPHRSGTRQPEVALALLELQLAPNGAIKVVRSERPAEWDAEAAAGRAEVVEAAAAVGADVVGTPPHGFASSAAQKAGYRERRYLRSSSRSRADG